ncbi:hypothetical protein NEIRO03_1742 [Nematocida sp. AWRm78]|nr:hypothetical protein NEIRO02_1782 [Nematocida sp. AWRm79]KAI5184465.1 hypothetical protein NEIRO03_1742 [Nematocida sp. AWRm78]
MRTGRGIEIISKSGVRYSGILSNYDSNKGTVTLCKVRSFGSENRVSPVKIQVSEQIYEYIVFKIENIKGVKEGNEWVSITTGDKVIINSVRHNKEYSRRMFSIRNECNTSCKESNQKSLTKGIIIPDEEYDFISNNKELQKDIEKIPYEHKNTYDPSFFYDSLR